MSLSSNPGEWQRISMSRIAGSSQYSKRATECHGVRALITNVGDVGIDSKTTIGGPQKHGSPARSFCSVPI